MLGTLQDHEDRLRTLERKAGPGINSDVWRMQIAQNLALYVPFSGDMDDKSGFGDTGTPAGGAALTSDRFSRANQAVLLDGDASVTWSEVARHDTPDDFSVCIQIVPTNLPAVSEVQALLSKGNSWKLQLQEGGVLAFSTYISAAEQKLESDLNGFEIIEDTPYSILCTRRKSDGLQRIYIGGQLVAEDNFTTGSIDTNNTAIVLGAGSNGFIGKADDLYLINRELHYFEALAFDGVK